MKRMKKFLVSALAAASFFLLTGCGNETIMEEYSFGYTQLKSGNSEVYLMTPVQLGEMHQKDGTNFYGANDAHWIITAESRPASSTSVQAWAEEPTYMLAQTATLSDPAEEKAVCGASFYTFGSERYQMVDHCS